MLGLDGVWFAEAVEAGAWNAWGYGGPWVLWSGRGRAAGRQGEKCVPWRKRAIRETETIEVPCLLKMGGGWLTERVESVDFMERMKDRWLKKCKGFCCAERMHTVPARS